MTPSAAVTGASAASVHQAQRRRRSRPTSVMTTPKNQATRAPASSKLPRIAWPTTAYRPAVRTVSPALIVAAVMVVTAAAVTAPGRGDGTGGKGAEHGIRHRLILTHGGRPRP